MKKLVLAIVLLGWFGLLATLWHFEKLRDRNEVPEFVTRPYADSRSCQKCHQDIYEEWSRSPHAKALSSTHPRMMNPGDKVTNCLPCHTPEPVLINGLEKPPLARLERREEGVDCLTCHQVSQGVASSHRGLRGACQPVYDARLADPSLCQGCHNAHGTVDQWRASHFAQQGQDCRSCHMPQNDGHSEHVMLGAHDHTSLAQATGLSLERKGQELIVSVSNLGAGHNLPSGRRSRSMVLVVRFSTPEGQWISEQRYLFRNPFKGESGENTQLSSGETRRHIYPIPKEVVKAKAQLLYQFRPSQPDSAGVLLQEQILELSSSPIGTSLHD